MTVTIAAWLALPPLALHAALTHGGWFAAIWLALPFALGFGLGAGATAPAHLGALAAVVAHLSALLAKGFVERTGVQGRIAPFVAIQFAAAALIAWPLEVASRAIGAQILPAPTGQAVAAWSALAASFGLAYRTVSRRTADNRVKFFVLLAVVAAVLAAAHALR